MRNNFKKIVFLTIWLICALESGAKLEERQIKRRYKRFVCPGDGKWPDETDCGKFHTCQGSSETSGWCGPGMSFDTDNQRCEMALAINCKDGERPDWKPPDNWQGKTVTTTTTTKKTSTTEKSDKQNSNDASQNPSKTSDGMKEGDSCSFKGLQSDKENCQSYFYCKENLLKKESCPDRQLFDEESKSCKEFKNVYCGERPVNDKGKDQCRSRSNGVYPNLENGCSDFYQCNNQKKVKTGECPQNLRFNILTLRCDRPANVPVPCGTKIAVSSANSFTKSSLFIFVYINSILFAILS